jgi:hypothetical protein
VQEPTAERQTLAVERRNTGYVPAAEFRRTAAA